MRLWLALKAFYKALRNPEQTKLFLLEQAPPPTEEGDPSHLRLLSLLQESGRLIDFFQEDISSYNDAQVGAAVRKIHQDCGQILEDLVTIRPVIEDAEGATINIPVGYDAMHLKIIGKVKKEPPFTGTVVHKGWKAHKRSLPKKVGEQMNEVLSPAEIEVRS